MEKSFEKGIDFIHQRIYHKGVLAVNGKKQVRNCTGKTKVVKY